MIGNSDFGSIPLYRSSDIRNSVCKGNTKDYIERGILIANADKIEKLFLVLGTKYKAKRNINNLNAYLNKNKW